MRNYGPALILAVTTFALFVCVGVLQIVGCDFGPSVQSSVTAAQKHFRHTLDALAKYHQIHGEYPARLDDLVRVGLLASIPSTPEVENAMSDGPWYEVDQDRKTFRFGFSYHLKKQGIGIGDTTYVEWQSKTGVWRAKGPGF